MTLAALKRRSKGAWKQLFDSAVSTIAGTITHVETTAKAAALTFDDGPDPSATPRLLDILAAHQAKATFFMVGRNAAQYPEIVARVAAEGHAIGNHSWDHQTFPSLDSRARLKQLEDCQRALGPQGLRLFRPPKGMQNLASRLDVLRAGYQVVTWSLGAEDWLERDADWMAERLITHLKPGSIICLHDALEGVTREGAQDRSHTLEAVDKLLRATSSQYQFVTVPQLMARGRVYRANWVM